MAASVANGKKAAALPEEVHRRKVFGWAARDSSVVLSPFHFSRRVMKNGANDVTIKIMYCGICHSDLHTIKNEWRNSIFPVVPGHEIVGEVIEVGSGVSKFRVGDKPGVGCMVNSCRSCASCGQGCENYCPGVVYTYNSLDADGSTPTFGGYSDAIVIDEHFAVRIPDSVALDRAAPMLCAGITVYSPMKRFGLDQPGMHLGVVGLGGLGHMCVKFARAFGMKVTVISTSPSKKEEAIERLGADAFLLSRDTKQMKAAAGTMDGIINTVSAVHDLSPLVDLLKYHGKMILVGAPPEPLQLHVFPLLVGGKVIAGSGIGGMKETQEMIDFAAKHNVGAEIELININYVSEAMQRLMKADVRYRFVIDIANSLHTD